MIVRRKFSLMEVLQLIPVVHEFRIRNPQQTISVETDYPEAFLNNPDVEEAAPFVDRMEPVLRLDGVERQEEFDGMHLMDAFAFSLLGDNMLSSRTLRIYDSVPCDAENAGVVISNAHHPLVCSLVKLAVFDSHESLLLDESAVACANVGYLHGVISKGKVFVGPDGDHLAIAMTTDVPIVALMDKERAKTLEPFRRGVPFHVVSSVEEVEGLCRKYL